MMLTKEEKELLRSVKYVANDVMYLLDIWRPLFKTRPEIVDVRIRKKMLDLKRKFEHFRIEVI